MNARHRGYGTWAATTMLLVVGFDVVRKVTPNQPVSLSLLPLATCVLGALLVVLRGQWRQAPAAARRAVLCILSMLLMTGLVGIYRGLPISQIAAGALSHGVMIPGIVLGYALAARAPSWSIFRKTVLTLLVLNCAIAALQQFGYLQTGLAEAIEGVSAMRGVAGQGVFTYTTGLFRTSEVFVAFLALAAIVVCASASEPGPTRLSRLTTGLLLAATFGAAILTARRSGFLVQVGAVLPFVLLYVSRARASVAVGAAILVLAFQNANAPSEVNLKIQHMGVPEGLGTRLEWAFNVAQDDWNLVSPLGDGLGSHRFAVRAGGPRAEAMEVALGFRHPLLHYSWFADLVELGPVGAFLHLVGLISLLGALFSSARRSMSPNRWSGAGYFATALVVYYFVSAALMLTISNGMMMGFALGISLIPQRPSHGGT